MSHDTDELILKIDTQKSDENPYEFKNKSKPIRRSKINKSKFKKTSQLSKETKNKNICTSSSLYEIVYPHSHLLLLVSIALICLYYTSILKIGKDFLLEKCYHSICLGLMCLIDFLISREQIINNENLIRQDNDTNSIQEVLIQDPTKQNGNLKLKYKNFNFTKKKMILFSLILGLISFASELLTFYLLNITTKKFHYNASIGYALLALEIILIRIQYSFINIKIEFINFLGLLLIFTNYIFVSINYLTIPLACIAFFITVLRFTKFYILLELSTYRMVNMKRLILLFNLVDFFIGGLITFIYILIYYPNFLFISNDLFLILLATSCYYINLKYFRDFDRYGITIISLTYPLITVFDLFINQRQISFLEFIITIFMTGGTAIGFLGDKIFEIDDTEDSEEKIIL